VFFILSELTHQFQIPRECGQENELMVFFDNEAAGVGILAAFLEGIFLLRVS